MNRARRNLWLTIALLPLLAACSTPASQHYLLTAADVPAPSGMTPSIGVGPVSVSEYLNRDSLVQRSGGNRLAIASTERWAEPLEDGITRVVGLNLAGLLQTEDVRRFPWHPQRPPTYGVRLRVLEMDSDASGANLVAEWLVYRVEDGSSIERRLSKRQAAVSGAAADNNAVVSAYSDLLFQLSEDIASAVRGAETEGGQSGN